MLKKTMMLGVLAGCLICVFVSVQAQAELVGHWSFDDRGEVGSLGESADGDTACDTTSYSKDGTIHGCKWGWKATNDNSAVCGGGLSFDGVDDYVEVLNYAPWSLSLAQRMTLSLWLKTTHTGSNQGILSLYDNHGEWNYQLYSASNGKIRYNIGKDNTWATTLTSNQSVNDGSWHFVTAKYDGGNMYIYIDGVLDNTVPETRVCGSGQKAYIGTCTYNADVTIVYGPSDVPFHGAIDEVRIYNYALTADEITKLLLIKK